MRTRLAVAGSTLLALLFSMLVLVWPAHAAVGFHISGGRLIDANGNEFIMRGVSHPHVWYPSETGAFADIKSHGANTVRVVLGSGQRWGPNSASDVANVVSLCKQSRLICVLEVHDTTGYGEEGAAATLDQAVDYWISIQSALEGQEDYILINIGNEPYGNNQGVNANWVDDTSNAIQRLRDAGFDHTLTVNAPNWGQDWQFIMRDNAATVFNSDPDRNTMFGIHMYGVFDTAAEVNSYLNTFVDAGLPILVGEFGHNHSDGNPDEDTIMATAQSLGVGYIGWSWSGNSGGVEYLDMVNNFDVNSLTSWGQRIFYGANGIAETAREASVYGGNNGDTTPPTTPGTPTPTDVASNSVSLSWAASTDDVGVTGYEVVSVEGSAETVVASSSTNSATVTELSPSTEYTFAVYARDAAGNRSARSGTVDVNTLPGDGNGDSDCAVDYQVINEWPDGFQGDITITNTSTSPIDAWTLRWMFANGQTIGNMWGGTPSQVGPEVAVTNVSWTANIPPGGSVNVGFIGTWNSTNADPTAFTLNDVACSVS